MPEQHCTAETISEIKNDIKTLLKGQTNIFNILNGNGKIGMCAKVNIVWGAIIFILSAAATGAVVAAIKCIIT